MAHPIGSDGPRQEGRHVGRGARTICSGLGERSRGTPFLTVFIAACLLAVATVLGACGDDVSSSDTEVFVQGEGEILLEPAGSAGPESFAGEIHVVRGPSTASPASGQPLPTQPQVTVPPGQVTTWPGDTPGVYGGSRNRAVCDKEAQLRFLEENPEKAKAFCEALNSDPSLQWSGGTEVQPDQLPAYFAELTPLVLSRDTRVTNHGYRDGRPTPRQSVLQAGQGVLVDAYGVPRVRCECGNPLIPPQPVKAPSAYAGPPWEDFDPTAVIAIQPSAAVVEMFVVVDLETGEVFDRPPGTSGEGDIPHMLTDTTTGPPTASTSTTTTSPPTTVPGTSTTTTSPPTTVPGTSTTTTRPPTTTTTVAVPAAPSGVRVFWGFSGAPVITWRDNSDNEDGFYVTDGMTTVSVPADTTVYSWNDWDESRLSYRVSAYNSAGRSSWSAWATVGSP